MRKPLAILLQAMLQNRVNNSLKSEVDERGLPSRRLAVGMM